jgi:hypothetical protein
LEDERPGNQRKKKKDTENSSRHPTGLRKDVENVADESGEKQRSNFSPSEKLKFKLANST